MVLKSKRINKKSCNFCMYVMKTHKGMYCTAGKLLKNDKLSYPPVELVAPTCKYFTQVKEG